MNDEQRNKDIIELCKQVINARPNIYYNSNGRDESTCPFCGEYVYWSTYEMNEIKHSPNCAYLIAKDVSTNLF